MTLEPDGTATGCNPVEVGSTPTGVSDCPTAGSDYILKMCNVRTIPSLDGLTLLPNCLSGLHPGGMPGQPKRLVSMILRWAPYLNRGQLNRNGD